MMMGLSLSIYILAWPLSGPMVNPGSKSKLLSTTIPFLTAAQLKHRRQHLSERTLDTNNIHTAQTKHCSKCTMCFGLCNFFRSRTGSNESASSTSSRHSARARRAQLWAASHQVGALPPVPPGGGLNFVYIVRRTEEVPAP